MACRMGMNGLGRMGRMVMRRALTLSDAIACTSNHRLSSFQGKPQDSWCSASWCTSLACDGRRMRTAQGAWRMT